MMIPLEALRKSKLASSIGEIDGGVVFQVKVADPFSEGSDDLILTVECPVSQEMLVVSRASVEPPEGRFVPRAWLPDKLGETLLRILKSHLRVIQAREKVQENPAPKLPDLSLVRESLQHAAFTYKELLETSGFQAREIDLVRLSADIFKQVFDQK